MFSAEKNIDFLVFKLYNKRKRGIYMKCTNCGFENRDDFTFCANCGAQKVLEPTILNAAQTRALTIVNSKLFLALCILLTVASGLSVIIGSIQIIPLLLTIFMWMAYANGKKGKVNFNDFHKISGTVYANYIIINVVAIILIIIGFIFTAPFGILDLPETLVNVSPDLEELLTKLPNISLGALSILFGVLFIFAGVVALVVNVLLMRKIHRFTKEFYTKIITGEPEFLFAKTAKNCLIFFAVVNGIEVISTFSTSFISGLIASCLVAAIILTIIVIDKYILTPPNFEA